MSGGKIHPRSGQPPRRWKVWAKAVEAKAEATRTVNFIVSVCLAWTRKCKRKKKRKSMGPGKALPYMHICQHEPRLP